MTKTAPATPDCVERRDAVIDALRTELIRASDWMELMHVREKAACYRKGYQVRIEAARAAIVATK